MVRKIILLSALMMIFQLTAQNQEEIFEHAVSAFENKEYAKSLELFLQLENENILNADLYYNLGNCYFRLNQLGKSILYYKKALKLRSDHKQAQRNLDYALTLTKDKQIIENDALTEFWHKLVKSLPTHITALILLVNFFLIVIMINLIILRYKNREKTVPIFILFIIGFSFLFLVLLNYLKWSEFSNNKEAVLIAGTAIGYSGPSEEFTRVFTIHEGMILVIERNEADWSLVKLPNGLGGWIRSAKFEIIDFNKS
ncbi:MAG: tetratricopeptide repeat protein [Candidatus Cloacimonetes bacterium]|nr:tetratricopeptide repeat protein [Candidatus Cloacimonadota bacterium]